MTAALEFNSVCKTFRKGLKSVQALKNITFSVDEGEVFGFVGPNGAGKSTTIKIMLDVINDYEGEVRLYGKSARYAASRTGIAYVPEAPALYEQFTPLEILRMALQMYNIKFRNADTHCLEWLERLSVAHTANRKIHELSKGTVQRVAIAHAMVVNPRLLVLDEPLSGLDPVGRRDVVDILSNYKNNGGAIFFTSHVLHDVERIADRFGFINQGELVTTRSPRELLTDDADRFIARYQSEHPLTDSGVQIRDSEYEIELSQSEIEDWIQKINTQGGRLIAIQPAISLEKVFFRILDEYKK